MTDCYILDTSIEIIAFDIGVKHLAFCMLENEKNFKFGMFDISAKTPIDRLKNLHNSLKLLPLPKLVVIEQQVITNSVAMTIQSAITMFYLTEGINVKLYNPKEKFKIDNLKKFKGKEHKQLSISYARNILEKTNLKQLSDFEHYTKKDDIADALCMALFTYLNDENKISKLIHS
ncbi:MAG: hypothetical protein MJ211_15880 [Bacteroidales bacterium]|nr:hypothetical protein [Bacteroidales bacterium]